MPIDSITGVDLTDAAAKRLAQLEAENARLRNEALKNTKVSTTPGGPEAMGKDTFLKLLVAQLKYQNPSSPTDPTAFMTQTAQFSMVERLEETSKATTELLAMERSRSATALLGNQVTWNDGSTTEKTGVVTGVRMGADGPTLVVGDKDVPYASITKVTPAPAAVTAPTS